MLEFLAGVDRVLFDFINLSMANPITNWLMPLVTSDNLLRSLYGLTMLTLLWKGNARQRWLVLASALVLVLTDQIVATLLKPLIARPRPCQILEHVNLLVSCGSGKAMPSAHAANAFGQAFLFAFYYVNLRWYLLSLATLIALSRVFSGVHYPGDIIVGGLIGAAIGLIMAILFQMAFRKLGAESHSSTAEVDSRS